MDSFVNSFPVGHRRDKAIGIAVFRGFRSWRRGLRQSCWLGGRGTRSGGEFTEAIQGVGRRACDRAEACGYSLGIRRFRSFSPSSIPTIRAAMRSRSQGLDLPAPVMGGATRQASVLAGLNALERAEPDFVLIHDAARPFATSGSRGSRDRGSASERRRDPGLAGHRHGEGSRCARSA